MSVDHSGHRARLKAALRDSGALGFAPHEVTELMLYTALPRRDVNELAHTLTETLGGVGGVLNAEETELKQAGAGETTAKILSAFGSCVRACGETANGHFLNTRGDLKLLLARAESYEMSACALLSPGREVLFFEPLPRENPIRWLLSRLTAYEASTVLLAVKDDATRQLLPKLRELLNLVGAEIHAYERKGELWEEIGI